MERRVHKHGTFANVFVTSVNGADSRSTNPLDGVDDLVASLLPGVLFVAF